MARVVEKERKEKVESHYNECLEQLKSDMKSATDSIGGVISSKIAVDELVKNIINTLQEFEFKAVDHISQVLIMNRAMSVVHINVIEWFSEACAKWTATKEATLQDAIDQNIRLTLENESLRDLNADALLSLRETAILSVNPKDRAANWNTKKSKDNFKKFVKGKMNETKKKKAKRV